MKMLNLWQVRRFSLRIDEEDLRHGLQLAVAVLIAYLTSLALALPEGLWAVMSALIVMRVRTGTTIGQAWGRIQGTLLGTLGGLSGVWLHSAGVMTMVATLGVVVTLAFVTALAPALRSAPITALIILSGGGIGHSAWQVAGLRVAEITLGIAVGLTVSLLTSARNSAAHYHDNVRSLLEDIGMQTGRSLTIDGWSASERERVGRETRARLVNLTVLATSADTEHRLAIGNAGSRQPGSYRRHAALVSRVVQDAAIFGRIFEVMPAHRGDPLWTQVAEAVSAALAHAADRIVATDGLAGLTDCLRPRSPELPESPPHAELQRLLAAPITLLSADIRALICRD